jgi:Spy/CpxP family protein refolding chaperone
MPISERPLNWKLIGAAVLLVGALVFVYAQWRSTQPPSSTEARSQRGRMAAQERETQREISDEERARRRTERNPEGRRQRQEEIFQQLNLTEEQRAQIEALEPVNRESGQEARMARQQAMTEILTEEQLTRMRELRRQRAPQPQGDGTEQRRPRRGPGQGPAEQP